MNKKIQLIKKGEKLNYFDTEDLIIYFWECSENKEFKGFDWVKAFNNLEYPLFEKLAIHGLLEFEDFENAYNEIYTEDSSDLNNYAQVTDYLQITTEEIRKAILKYKYERNRKEFSDYETFIELKKLYDDVLKAQDISNFMELKDFIILFDKVIHAQHETGNIFDSVDIEKLRGSYEND